MLGPKMALFVVFIHLLHILERIDMHTNLQMDGTPQEDVYKFCQWNICLQEGNVD